MASLGWSLHLGTGEVQIGRRRHQLHRLKTSFHGTTPAVLLAEIRIPANSIKVVDVYVPEVATRQIPDGVGSIEGNVNLAGDYGVLPGLNAIVRARPNGRVAVCLCNPSNRTRRVPAGACYGLYTPTAASATDLDDNPHRIHVINSLEPQRHDSKAEYFRKFAEKQKALSDTPDDDLKRRAASFAEMSSNERRAWLTSYFKLNDSPFIKSVEDLTMAQSVLLDNWDLFSFDGSFGATELISHSIDTGSARPVKAPYRAPNPLLYPNLKQHLNDLLRNDVIEPSESPWAANLVAAKKKGGQIRWCVNWIGLNDVTKKDTYPMPSIDDNMAKLAGSKVFSAIDMQGAFHAIPIDEADREKTSFRTPFGSYQYKRLGFGLTNGPAAYCRLVERVLAGVDQSVAIAFLDDFCIMGVDLKTHIANLRTTFRAIRRAGLRMSPKKCTFFADEINYLGHTLTADGIRPPQSFCDSIKDWPLPHKKSQARTFIGMVSYYRRHIKDFSAIAKPWTDIMAKTDSAAERKPLTVTKEMQTSFETLKSKLLERPILGLPHFSGPKAGRFILDTDFCDNQIAGILSQLQPEREVVLAYGSKKLNDTQRNYASTKGELYAGSYWMNKYRYYLQLAQDFLWRTDNSALTHIRRMEQPRGSIYRWLQILADYNFIVEHRAGAKHTNADSLSRGHAKDVVTTSSDDDNTVLPHEPLTGESINALFSLTTAWRITTAQLREQQELDGAIGPVLRWVRQNKLPSRLDIHALPRNGKIYARSLNQCSLSPDGLLLWRQLDGRPFAGKDLICLPESLWDDAIRCAHVTGGHMAVRPTLTRLLRSVYFPNMHAEVDTFVSSCIPCQAKGKKVKDQRHTHVSVLPGYFWQRLHIDHLGPFPLSKNNNKFLLTCRDAFSKWLEAIPVPDTGAETTAKALERELFARYGFPDVIHSDLHQSFNSELYKRFNEINGILITNTSGYNPKGNAQVETIHHQLNQMLTAFRAEFPTADWEDLLPQALFALRSSVCTSTGLSPFRLVFGHDPTTPLDLIFRIPQTTIDDESRPTSQYLADYRRRATKAHEWANRHLRLSIRRHARAYHQERRTFLPGAKVWLFTPTHNHEHSRKTQSMWTGPWTVSALPVNDVMVRIVPHPSWHSVKDSQVVSIDRLKLYKDDLGRNIAPISNADVVLTGDENAEFIRIAPFIINEDDAPPGQPDTPPNQAPPPAPPPTHHTQAKQTKKPLPFTPPPKPFPVKRPQPPTLGDTGFTPAQKRQVFPPEAEITYDLTNVATRDGRIIPPTGPHDLPIPPPPDTLPIPADPNEPAAASAAAAPPPQWPLPPYPPAASRFPPRGPPIKPLRTHQPRIGLRPPRGDPWEQQPRPPPRGDPRGQQPRPPPRGPLPPDRMRQRAPGPLPPPAPSPIPHRANQPARHRFTPPQPPRMPETPRARMPAGYPMTDSPPLTPEPRPLPPGPPPFQLPTPSPPDDRKNDPTFRPSHPDPKPPGRQQPHRESRNKNPTYK